jgi:hypothetical protein
MDAGGAAMKRSIGVTLSAVVTILGSALTALFGVLMLLSSTVRWGGDSDEPPYIRVAGFVMAGMMFALTAWGVTTATGLIRLRRWARVCILVFSALMALCSGAAALMTAVVPLPSTPNAPAGLMTGVRIGIACFYGILTLIGGWWLYLFNRASVVAQFAPGPPPARPLSVSVIAWFLLFGGAGCFVCTWLPFPMMLFSFTIAGWSARAVYALFALLQLWLGIGLLRLRPLSRVWAIGYFVFGLLNGLSFALLPGAAARFAEAMAAMPSAMQRPPQATFAPPLSSMVGMAIIYCAVPIWFLVRSRVAFLQAPRTQ